MDPLHLPSSPGGIGLLLVVLAACGWFFVYTIQRFNRRSQAEGDLDQRLPLILANVTAGWEKLNEKQAAMIDKAENRADKANEDREAILQRFLEYTTSREDVHNTQIERMRTERLDSDKRIHAKLEECLQRDSVNLTRFQEAVRRIDQLESRQYTAALVTPVGVAAPSVPVAPASFTVPASGLTITPAAS